MDPNERVNFVELHAHGGCNDSFLKNGNLVAAGRWSASCSPGAGRRPPLQVSSRGRSATLSTTSLSNFLIHYVADVMKRCQRHRWPGPPPQEVMPQEVLEREHVPKRYLQPAALATPSAPVLLGATLRTARPLCNALNVHGMRQRAPPAQVGRARLLRPTTLGPQAILQFSAPSIQNSVDMTLRRLQPRRLATPRDRP